MSCDLNHMSVDFGRYIRWCGDLVTVQKQMNHRLHDLVADIEGMDRDILKSEHDGKDPVLGARRIRYKDPRHLDELAISSTSFHEKTQNVRSSSRHEIEDEQSDPDEEHDLDREPDRQSSKTSRMSRRSSLVMASIKNSETFEPTLAITNEVRDEHGVERHQSLREEYDNSLEQFYQSHPRQAKKNVAAVADANKALGIEDKPRQLTERLKPRFQD